MMSPHNRFRLWLALAACPGLVYAGPGGGASGYVELFGLDAQSATYNVGSNVTLQDAFCVISSSTSGGTGTAQNWNIFGDTVISPWVLTMAGQPNITVSLVQYQGRIAGVYSPWTTLTTSQPSTYDYDGYLTVNCGDNAGIKVQVNDAALQGARAGTWTGQIALTARTQQTGKTVTATGNWQVSVIVPALAQVSGLTDINATWSGTGDQQSIHPFCVYSNTAAQTVGIRFSSFNGTGQFLLKGATTSNTIPYTLEFDNAGAGTTWQSVTEGSPLSAQSVSGGVIGGAGCTNVQMRFTALGSALSAVPADSYVDTITVLVTPT